VRAPQPEGSKGSLKWIQRAVERRPDLLCPPGIPQVDWRSPRREDDFAEYRDGAFLDLLGLSQHRAALSDFWPRGGPQWDALGRAGDVVILVEAKAHIAEFITPPSQASPASLAQIRCAFAAVHAAEGLAPPSDWTRCFYQLANRLAHLSFLRARGVPAVLLLVGFVGDTQMTGPSSGEAWDAAETAAFHALGVPNAHPLRKAVHTVHIDVSAL